MEEPGGGGGEDIYVISRKLVGYRNWRQWWSKKEGNKVWQKKNDPIFSFCK